MDNKSKLIDFAEHLKQADGLLITAGAGMGVDSGLPDFRGDNGFWTAYTPFQRLGKSFIDVATPQLFYTEPKLAWGFYGLRLNQYREVIPHNGFHLLKQWTETLPNLKHGSFVFTSNVDGEFQKVEFDDDQVFECHGSIHWLQCLDNCMQAIWSADDFKPVVDEEFLVTGFEEQYQNNNPELRTPTGKLKRSTNSANLLPKDTLGALIVYSQRWGTCRIGTGFTDELRDYIWNNKHLVLGVNVTAEYYPTVSMDKPHALTFKAFRPDFDMLKPHR